ncbi:MAG: outer rane beta-barrel protein [Chitinophagaceae bacterium]|nr:outer rane beta-barrel protein [Chitinophagaceae bacterium]
MNILARGLAFFLLLFSINSIKAQTVKGVLTDENDKSPLIGATVKLNNRPDSANNQDSSTAYTTVTNKDGVFIFENVTPKLYQLSVSSVGLGAFKMTINVKDSVVNDMGNIAISKTAKILNEVSVVATAPQVKQKVDTVEYSANQFKVNPDANVEDLIKKMPGITVDKAGTVTAQGEQVKKVTVDGRDFFGDDATAALRNLPAEIIDKIQVFDKLSDQAAFTGFDDGSSQKAINVVTKANMRNGQFGRMYAGYGTDDRYSAGGNVSFFKGNRRLSFVGLFNNINQQNFSSQDLLGVTSSGGGNRGGGQGGRGGGGQGGQAQAGRGGGGQGGGGQQNFLVGQQNGISKTNAIGLNYSNQFGKKLTLTGSYFFNNTNNSNTQLTNRQTFLKGDSSIYYKENSATSSSNYNNRINLRLEYKFDSSNTLTISPSLNFQKNNSSSTINAQQAYSGDFSLANMLNQSASSYNAATSGYNFNNTVFFRHAFQKRGRTISIGINTTVNHKLADSYSITDSKFFKNSVARDSLSNQFVDNLTNGHTISANLAYTEPMGKKGQLQLNYNPSFTKNKADQQTFQYDPVGKSYSLFDTRLSNKFDNTYNTQNGGITYRVGDRDNQFSVGTSIQSSNLKSDQLFPNTVSVNKTFTNILPNLQLRRKLSARSSVNVFFRTSVNAPSVTQLQNVENTTNTLQYSTGNPDLKQQYSSSLVTRFTYTNTLKGQSFFANLFVQQTKDYISNASFINFNSDSILPSGLKLPAGVYLTKPINLSGYWNARSFFTYGAPVKFIKSNINLNAGVSYSKLPGFTNNEKIITDNYTYNGGVVLSSNISQYVDFNLSYSTSYNAIVQQANNNYNTQSFGVQFNLLSKAGWFFQNDLNNQSYNYKSSTTPDQHFLLWNMSAGKKFLKDQKGELKLSVFDVLKQNKSISRTVTESYVEDIQSQVLQRYFMLTFTYKLKNFGTAAARSMNNKQRDERGF